MQYNNSGNTFQPEIHGHSIDWTYLLDIAERHGLTPLLYLFLADITGICPAEIVTQLHDRFKANALRNRILTQELLEVLELFEKPGIHALAYKGPVLTLQAYGDMNQRQFGDLDILIHENDVALASDILIKRDYKRTIPQLTPRQERDFLRTDHEHEFISPDHLVHIDLHWSLSTRRFPFQFNTTALHDDSHSIQWQNSHIKHMSTHDTLLFLCMHANKDLWRKWVWICDIDRLIRKHRDIDWKSLTLLARNTHSEKMLYTAILICHEILKTPLPSDVALEAPKFVDFKGVNAILRTSTETNKAGKSFLQCLAIEPYILSICDNWRDKFFYISRTLLTPTESDMLRYSLPYWLHFIYYIITPIRKIFFCSLRYIKRKILN